MCQNLCVFCSEEPGHVGEDERFMANPLGFLSTMFQGVNKSDLPSHIVLFSSLELEVHPFLNTHQYSLVCFSLWCCIEQVSQVTGVQLIAKSKSHCLKLTNWSQSATHLSLGQLLFGRTNLFSMHTSQLTVNFRLMWWSSHRHQYTSSIHDHLHTDTNSPVSLLPSQDHLCSVENHWKNQWPS